MCSQMQSKLTVLDLTREDLKPGTCSWLSTCSNVIQALEKHGCFIAVYDKLSPELYSSIFNVTGELFDLPQEIKNQTTSDKPLYGYYGNYANMPLYESLAIDSPQVKEAAQHFTNIMWPLGHDHFCETIHSYGNLMVGLEQMIVRMLLDGYGLERLCECHMKASTYKLRCFKYRVPEMGDSELGLRPHTDATFISILLQNDIGGLQIKSDEGDWVDVHLSPNSFLVLAGDALMAWTNGRIHSCTHRVIMSADRVRYSVGLFKFNAGMMDIPEEFVDERHPQEFKSFDNFDYLRFLQTEMGKKSKCPIRAYCGV